MTENHPITPSPELVQQWWEEADQHQDGPKTYFDHVATQAARWGADQELEACCAAEHTVYGKGKANWLRSLRRPKPPSLAEQALERLAWIDEKLEAPLLNHCNAIHTIRAALERLKQLEQESGGYLP